MRVVITANELDMVNNQNINSHINFLKKTDNYLENIQVTKILTNERSDNFSQYIEENDIALNNWFIEIAYHLFDYWTIKHTSARSVSSLLEVLDYKYLNNK